jgi:hypothetical protein
MGNRNWLKGSNSGQHTSLLAQGWKTFREKRSTGFFLFSVCDRIKGFRNVDDGCDGATLLDVLLFRFQWQNIWAGLRNPHCTSHLAVPKVKFTYLVWLRYSLNGSLPSFYLTKKHENRSWSVFKKLLRTLISVAYLYLITFTSDPNL